jgi:hypothetical protein
MIWLMILAFEPCTLHAMSGSRNMAILCVSSSRLTDRLNMRRVRGASSRRVPTNPGKVRTGSAYISKYSLKTIERALTAAPPHALTAL